MAKMWAGRTDGVTSKIADDFNSSISFDSRMYKQDITGSIAHAEMLCRQGIISEEDKDAITNGLSSILSDLESGALQIDENAEDIHMFVEQVLTERIGDAGKRLHTARSRNDQVALDLRMYVRDETNQIIEKIKVLGQAVTTLAEKHKTDIMPGYTHLQRAQPVTFAHHLLAYDMMFIRDIGRFEDSLKRLNISPIGSCALAGTTYNTDRDFEAEALGFNEVALNSMDGVSDRDFCVELLSAISLLMVHLSRFSEEIILWSSSEFRFVDLSDSYTTGSSIMPQKKNPDMAELTRGKSGRVFGDLMAMLTTLKGLPLAYNKDMQEDKESVFDAIDTAKICLDVFAGMIFTMKARPENMERACKEGFINATDLADYMVGRGLPFRDAYKISGQLVHKCIAKGCTLEDLTLEEYKGFEPVQNSPSGSDAETTSPAYTGALFDETLFDAIDIHNCVQRRLSKGGPSLASVEAQIAYVKKKFV